MANAWIIESLAGTAAASGTAPGRAADYVLNDFAGVSWKSDGGAFAWIQIDLGKDCAVDTVMIFGVEGVATTTPLAISAASDAQGSSFSDGGFTSFTLVDGGLAGSVIPASGRGVALGAHPNSISARFVRATFFDLPGAITASRLVVGKRIQLERNFSFGASFGVKDLGSLEFSRRGVLLRNRGAKLRTTSLSFSSVRKDEVEQLTKPLLERIGNTECVALVTDPAPDAQRQNRCYFGPLVGDLSQTWRRAGAWEAKINMVSIF